MKELLTLKEAASLAGRTTKTIKNYIKRGKITNFFLVEGKYGQEYRISVRDIEPFMKKARTGSRAGGASSAGSGSSAASEGRGGGTFTAEEIYDRPEYQFVLKRNDEILMDVGRWREKAESLERANLELRQELEEKNMLIAMLMKKEGTAPDKS